MPDLYEILSTTLHVLYWPTRKTLDVLGVLLSPFWEILQFVLLPLTYILAGIFNILSLPFRLNVLERVETIYIWLGVAGLIGCLTGVALFLVSKFLNSALKIDGARGANSRADGRTVKQFRDERRVRKEPVADGAPVPRVDRVAVLRRRGMAVRPIMEEESEF